MDILRVIISTMVFCISCYLVFDLFANGFNWLVLITSIAGFIAVHYIWPKKQTEDSAWYDILELIFDLPYRAIALALRSIGKIFRSGDLDVDI